MLMKFLPGEWSRQRQAETQIGKQKRCFGIIEALKLAELKTEPFQGCLVNER